MFMFCTIRIIGVRSGYLCDTERAAGCHHSARNERERDRRDEVGWFNQGRRRRQLTRLSSQQARVAWQGEPSDRHTPCATRSSPPRTDGRTDERTRGVVCFLIPLNGRAPERHHTLALICHMALCSWLSLGINVIISGMHRPLGFLSVRAGDYHFALSVSVPDVFSFCFDVGSPKAGWNIFMCVPCIDFVLETMIVFFFVCGPFRADGQKSGFCAWAKSVFRTLFARQLRWLFGNFFSVCEGAELSRPRHTALCLQFVPF